MKGGERERIGKVRRILQIAGQRIFGGDFAAEFFDDRAGVAHAVEEVLDFFAADAGQIVADAEIENRFADGPEQRIAGKLRIAAEHFDEHGAGDVFAERIFDAEFLRPFDVVADVGDVDAGAADGQAVVHLHGFQFQDAGARRRS